MGSLIKSWWFWAGLAVAALTAVIVLNSPFAPAPEKSPPPVRESENSIAQPEGPTPLLESRIASGEARDRLEAQAPVPATAPRVDLGPVGANPPENTEPENIAADMAALTESGAEAATPPAASLPEPRSPAPEMAGTPADMARPALATEAGKPPAAEGAPPPVAASLPLSLAEVLPPGAAPSPTQIAPSFDLVRVAPDGSTVIAGRAAPGANVQVFSGAVPIAEATASARGEFVVFLDMPTEQSPGASLPETPEGAQLVVSQDDILVLPAQPDMPDTAPTVLRRTPDSVEIVQPSGPAIAGNISLDLVSYAPSGAVKLAGRGQPLNTARIYANDALAGEAGISSGGNWALEIDVLAEGRYVLRVDEINPDGAVLSRTETPFQREFPEARLPGAFAPGARIIVQPGNTLWLMATEAYGSGEAYTQIFSANRDAIRDPDLIYPGQIFSIPLSGQ